MIQITFTTKPVSEVMNYDIPSKDDQETISRLYHKMMGIENDPLVRHIRLEILRQEVNRKNGFAILKSMLGL